MAQYIEWVWFFCLLIMTGHHLLIFRLQSFAKVIPLKEWPGVSIIIAYKNNADSLCHAIHVIQGQDYPLFEIIIVDDHSYDAETEKVQVTIRNYSNVRLVPNTGEGKKSAISTGVNLAQHDRILCTDADCVPLSDQWIKSMVSCGRSNEVVLGYAPLKNDATWLNKLIRFETLYTAIQYLSWAKMGRPYMGVGRNLLYPRMLFHKIDPYKGSTVAYGDDDMLVQKMSERARIKTCENPAAFMISDAPSSLGKWLRQKHRHLSAGHDYNRSAWWTPAIFGITLFLHWALVLPLLIFSLWWKWLPVLFIGLLIRWINYFIWTRRFGERDTAMWYPFFEIIYSTYLVLGGLFTAFIKKRSWN
jgi:glycosyltransferase involved in cell wall biosynthesis